MRDGTRRHSFTSVLDLGVDDHVIIYEGNDESRKSRYRHLCCPSSAYAREEACPHHIEVDRPQWTPGDPPPTPVRKSRVA
jgi:hypothetical protein